MRRILMMALVGLVVSGPALGRDASNRADLLSYESCAEYLEGYSQATLKGDNGWRGTAKSFGSFGWISGFLSAYNVYKENGKRNILTPMTLNDAFRWLASWCRDNPSSNSSIGLSSLIEKLDKQ